MTTRRTLTLALALLMAAALPSLFAPDDAGAKETRNGAQLLVKCATDEVPGVLAALANKQVRVYDLATMRELQAPNRPGAVPALASAPKTMGAFEAQLRKVATTQPGLHLQLVEVAIKPDRMHGYVMMTKPDGLDALPGMIAADPYFRARGSEISFGPLSKVPGGRWRVLVQLRFKRAFAAAASPVGLDRISIRSVHASAHAAQMEPMYASAERREYKSRIAAHLLSREFTFEEATLSKLRTLLAQLAEQKGLVVTELRWKLKDKKANDTGEDIWRPVVKLTTRTPTAR